MGKLEDMVKRLRGVSVPVVEDGILHIIQDNAHLFIDANINQLMRGQDAKGGMLRAYASEDYAKFKKTLNPRGVTDLHLTGSFHSGIFVDASAFPIEIDSSDEKTKDLKADYGNDITGVSKESLHEISRDYLKGEFQDFYRALIF